MRSACSAACRPADCRPAGLLPGGVAAALCRACPPASRIRRLPTASRPEMRGRMARDLPGAQIEPRDVAVLRRGVDDVRILGIVARLEAVAAADDVPVAGADAPAIERARRAALRPVVLRAAAHVVERLRVVDRHAVVLRHRQVREEAERRAFVVGLVDAAVVADQDVFRIDGSNSTT